MAAAGIENFEGPANDTAFQDALSAITPEIQELAAAVRALVFDVYPRAVEVVWPTQRSIGWGIGPKKFTEQFAYLMPYKAHVTLGFYHGGELTDPDGLLPDSGGKQVSGTLSMRSLKIRRVEDVSSAALRSLIEEAARHQAGLIAAALKAPVV